MARSVKDALLQAGLVRPEDTPEARRERDRQERRAREAAELAERMADTRPPPSWEAPPAGRIVDETPPEPPATRAICTDCAEPFDPTAAEHKPHGRADQCGPCALGEAAGPRRRRGQMVWAHKTAPALEIEGGPPLSPEELAAMRRR
jgi:hypothetical protein